MAVASFSDPHGRDPAAAGDEIYSADDVSNTLDPADDPHGQDLAAAGPTYSSSLLLLQQRISQTHPGHVPLSPHALKLLKKASSHISSSSLAAPPPPLISSSTDHLLTPLYQQLQSLRQLIPLQPTQADTSRSSPSCLITSALDYLEQLNREKQCLYEKIIQESSHCFNASYIGEGDHQPPFSSNVDSKGGLVKVEHLRDLNFHVHVQCEKRQGLISRLLFALESLGLVIDQMNVSYNQMLTLDLITSKVKQLKRLDGNVVQEVLRRTIDAMQKY